MCIPPSRFLPRKRGRNRSTRRPGNLEVLTLHIHPQIPLPSLFLSNLNNKRAKSNLLQGKLVVLKSFGNRIVHGTWPKLDYRFSTCHDKFIRFVRFVTNRVVRTLPAQRSVKFLMSMLVAFFALMEPASRNANPACISKMSEPMATRKKSSCKWGQERCHYPKGTSKLSNRNV